MDKYIYTEKDFDRISWERIEKFVDKNYQEIFKSGYKVKYIIPIIRGGAIPAMMLSHKLNNISILPIQLKYTLEEYNIAEMISLDSYNVDELKDDEVVLLVEGNCASGRTFDIAKKMIINKFGKDVKIIFSCLTMDYSRYIQKEEGIVLKTVGMLTNENKELSEEECENLGISYDLVSLYPWEDMEEELKELNL